MKFKLILISLLLASSFANAQFFGPKPKPYTPGGELKWGLSTALTPATKFFVKPLISVSATFSNGASLGGGAGVSFQYCRADSASNTYVIKWAISPIAFLTVNSNKLGGVGGIVISVPGTAGLINVGGGRDFTNNAWVFITGAGFTF